MWEAPNKTSLINLARTDSAVYVCECNLTYAQSYNFCAPVCLMTAVLQAL